MHNVFICITVVMHIIFNSNNVFNTKYFGNHQMEILFYKSFFFERKICLANFCKFLNVSKMAVMGKKINKNEAIFISPSFMTIT